MKIRIADRQFVVIAIIAIALALCALIVPARADNYATNGNGKDTTTFFVESYGNAKIKFSQTEGLCHELSYTHLIDGIQGDEDEWGMYHIQVQTPNGGAYTEDWAYTFNGGNYTLSLGGAGIYKITVVPYSGYEITNTWTLDQFISWTRYPQWWIDDYKNCRVMSNITASVYVQQVDQDTKAVLSSRSVSLNYGSNTVSAGNTPSGYTLTSSSSVSVSVDQNGRASMNTVTFYYRRNAPTSATVTVYCYDEYGSYLNSYNETVSSGKTISPRSISGYTATSGSTYVSFNSSTGTCSPSSVTFYYRKNSTTGRTTTTTTTTTTTSNSGYSSPTGRIVTPYSWDTQNKPGYTQSSKDLYGTLSNLYDDNSRTNYWWTIWKAERQDDIPELTAYFSGDTVSSICIRNGKLGDFRRFARLASFRIVIYHNGGTSTTYVYLPDEENYDYQTLSLGGTYSGVSRIEMYLNGGANEGYYKGSYEPYYIYITDIQFRN